MTIDKWNEIVSRIREQFEVEEIGEEELGDVARGIVRFIEFSGPLGRMRLELESKPVILDKKTIHSNRMGTSAAVQYIYSDTEFTHTFYALRFDEAINNWVEIEQEKMAGFSV